MVDKMINVSEQQNLLLNVSKKLEKSITVYAVGGTAMMYHGFKDVTKDIDLVFMSEEDRSNFRKAAEELDYEKMDPITVYGSKPNLPIMLKRGKGDEERFDLFVGEVISFYFSEQMVARAKATYEFEGNLILKVADPHDIIVMKCATGRVKDLDDGRQIINNYKMDWNIIFDEITVQLKLGKDKAIWCLTEFVTDLKAAGANIPRDILEKLYKLLEKQAGLKEEQVDLSEFVENL